MLSVRKKKRKESKKNQNMFLNRIKQEETMKLRIDSATDHTNMMMINTKIHAFMALSLLSFIDSPLLFVVSTSESGARNDSLTTTRKALTNRTHHFLRSSYRSFSQVHILFLSSHFSDMYILEKAFLGVFVNFLAQAGCCKA
jgi:hypothetical protein